MQRRKMSTGLLTMALLFSTEVPHAASLIVSLDPNYCHVEGAV